MSFENTKNQLLEPLNRDSTLPLNVKGVYPTAEAKTHEEGTKQTPQKGGLGQKIQEQEIGQGLIPRNRGSKMREEKEFEELAQDAKNY
ncbi:4979_t:CDS:2 [Scutellospora calospora]|uniref:4979_t:CDS:1 n=1 Tax=Scutellospora calospora TaxID=85575 RepID=A0ACA9MQ66_9GLOM|nr:4979_t:CDS:2 [Scutellospora calospora]